MTFEAPIGSSCTFTSLLIQQKYNRNKIQSYSNSSASMFSSKPPLARPTSFQSSCASVQMLLVYEAAILSICVHFQFSINLFSFAWMVKQHLTTPFDYIFFHKLINTSTCNGHLSSTINTLNLRLHQFNFATISYKGTPL